MSRGGRGGGRGGRGGGRGGRPIVPWDTGDEPDSRPSELFPPYKVPHARPLTASETSSIHHFLLLRRQIHSSTIYTSKRTNVRDPTAPQKIYSQAQNNALYGVKNKASVDPFTSVPMYSQRFVREERALPDWSRRPICRKLFPDELLDTIDPQISGTTGGSRRKKRRLELSAVNSLPNAEEAFGMVNGVHDEQGAGEDGDEAGRARLMERLNSMQGEEDGENAGGEYEEEEEKEEEDQDEVYDDEDAGDYNAENYFDNGDEMGEDYGEDGDEGTF